MTDASAAVAQPPTHYTLTVTAEQLALLRDATEVCARFLIGQTDSITLAFLAGLPTDEFCELRDRLAELGPLVTGERPNHFKARSPELARIKDGLFLLHQAVRQPLYLDRCAAEGTDPGWAVSRYGPHPVPGWEMPQICAGKVEGEPWTKP